MKDYRILEEHIVPVTCPPYRLSDYIPLVFTVIPSKKGLKKAIKKGCILVNHLPADTSHWIQPGELISLIEPPLPPQRIFEQKLEVIFEDEDLAAIVKPGGLLTNGNAFQTLENALPYNLKPSSKSNALQKLRPVHRLDRDTNGIVLIAKTSSAIIHLGQQFAHHTIQKTYEAIVIGPTLSTGRICIPIDGKKAKTDFRQIKMTPSLKNEWLSHLELYPSTGRTHQIRRHLHWIGHSILGDKLYYKEGLLLKGKGLFLAAVRIQFQHPTTGKNLELKINPPNKFGGFMAKESKRFHQYHTKP